MASILTNVSAQTALATLRNVSANLQETQQRISTGLEVRSARDNPAFFLVSQQVRGDQTVLDSLNDNLTLSVNAARTAANGIDSIFSNINQIQETLTTADSDQALEELQFAIDNLAGEISGTINATSFNGVNLLAGNETSTVTTTVTREAGEFNISTFTLRSQNLGDVSQDGRLRDAFELFAPDLQEIFDANGDNSFSVSTTTGFISDNQASTALITALDANADDALGVGGLDDAGANNRAVAVDPALFDVDGRVNLTQLNQNVIDQGGVDFLETLGISFTDRAIGRFETGDLTIDDAFADADGDGAIQDAELQEFLGESAILQRLQEQGATGIDENGRVNTDNATVPAAGEVNIDLGGGAFLQFTGLTAGNEVAEVDAILRGGALGGAAVSITDGAGAAADVTVAASEEALENQRILNDFAALVDPILGGAAGPEDVLTVDVSNQGDLQRLIDAGFNVAGTVDDASGNAQVAVLDLTAATGVQNPEAAPGVNLTNLERIETATSDRLLREAAGQSGFTGVLRQIQVAGESGNVQAGLVLTDALIEQANLAASTLGTFERTLESRQEFLTNLSDSLDQGVSSLVEADLDEESTRLQALQTQEQLAIQALTIANSQSQNILSLFR